MEKFTTVRDGYTSKSSESLFSLAHGTCRPSICETSLEALDDIALYPRGCDRMQPHLESAMTRGPQSESRDSVPDK